MDGGTFVAYFNDAHSAPGEVVPNRLDMPALQPEDGQDSPLDREVGPAAATVRSAAGVFAIATP